jgi:hypothetical protein
MAGKRSLCSSPVIKDLVHSQSNPCKVGRSNVAVSNVVGAVQDVSGRVTSTYKKVFGKTTFMTGPFSLVGAARVASPFLLRGR